jgi:hypothetical protein
MTVMTGTEMTGLLAPEAPEQQLERAREQEREREREREQEREQLSPQLPPQARECLPSAARERAIAAAHTLLHQPAATAADEAWHVVSTLDQLAVEFRAAYAEEQAAGEWQHQWQWQWLVPAAALVTRLEEATAWWTGRSRFPWSNWADWDTSATEELGMLLCELDAMAAELLTAATAPESAVIPESAATPESAADADADAAAAALEPDTVAVAVAVAVVAAAAAAESNNPTPLPAPAVPMPFCPSSSPSLPSPLSPPSPPSSPLCPSVPPSPPPAVPPVTMPFAFPVAEPTEATSAATTSMAAATPESVLFPLDDDASQLSHLSPPPRRQPARLLPSLSFAAVAMIGVIGGVTATTTHGATAAVPHTSIAGEPVPFTLLDGGQAQSAAPSSLPSSTASGSSGTSGSSGSSAASGAAVGAKTSATSPTGPYPATAQPPPAPAAAARASAAAPSPRHAAPKPRTRSAPLPANAAGPYQAQLNDLVADIRASAEQQAARQLSPLSQRAAGGFAAAFSPWD